MIERAWVLRRTICGAPGKFDYLGKASRVRRYGHIMDGGSEWNKAVQFATREAADRAAQEWAFWEGKRAEYPDSAWPYSTWHATPIERETERVVEEIEGPAELWVLHDDSGTDDSFIRRSPAGAVTNQIKDAKVYTADALFKYRGALELAIYIPIPVRVIETPGEWREVEDEL